MPDISFKINIPLKPSEVAQVFSQSGIHRPTADLDRIERMLHHANLTCSAWDKTHLIGIGRALTDFSYCCYLSDLAVAKAYQHQGIGRKIVEHIQSIIGDEVTLILLSSVEAMNYYPKIGFSAINNGFMIKRKK
ncbi:MAG: GNAT family N-acetyltransferase [Proteobacteria bacterium]|nr:GNAT family N-acetyltransferase [Pseudomonadota bacterium]